MGKINQCVHVHGKFSDKSDTYFTKHSFTRNGHGFRFPLTTEFESCFLNEYSTKLADTVILSIRKYDSQNNICKVFRFKLTLAREINCQTINCRVNLVKIAA